ncbi:MAG: DUF2975 domain-containing protein [Dokdonella sp.]
MTGRGVVEIRRRSASLCRLITVLAATLWLLLLLERFGAVGLRIVQNGADATSLGALAAQAVAAIPDIAYLFALGGVRHALSEFASGHFYVPTVARMLDRVGVLLAAGAFVGIFVVPGLQRAFGAQTGYWIGFNVSALVLGVLGLSLTVIARVFGQAAALKAELDEIF